MHSSASAWIVKQRRTLKLACFYSNAMMNRLLITSTALMMIWVTTAGFQAASRTTTASSVRRRQNRLSALLASTSSDSSAPPPAYGLYEVQEEMLIKRGCLEEELMAGGKSSPLQANKPKGVGGAKKGFGGGGGGSSRSSGSKSGFKQEAKSHAAVLRKEGVVRIDNVLSDELCDRMRKFVFDLRQDSMEQIEAGTLRPTDRFADVLLRSNRCDLKIPLGESGSDVDSPVIEALHHVFCHSAVTDTIETVLTDQAVLYELSCLISFPGSQRQVIHPDNPYLAGREDPTLLTCFIALQDVDMDMGPTVFLPRTNNEKDHTLFQDETVDSETSESPKDKLLRTKKSVLGILPKGCCSLYDSRLLHCGSANKSDTNARAIFYFSFRNPEISYPGNPASIRADLGQARLTLKDLKREIKNIHEHGQANRFGYA